MQMTFPKCSTPNGNFVIKIQLMSFTILNTYIVSVCSDLNRYFMASVNVSRACITIPAGYVCVVRSGTAQDQPFQGWIFGAGIQFPVFLSALSLPMPRPNNIRVLKKALRLFLGLRQNPSRGLPTTGGCHISIGNSWGPLKLTNNFCTKFEY